MKSPHTNIGIIGGGALGGALGSRLVTPQVAIQFWDVNPDLRTAASLDELVASSDIILICTPSQTNRVIAREIAQVITEGPGPAVISLAKGIEPGFKTMDTVLSEELGGRFVTGIISGPMLAAEVTDGLTAGATVATTDPAITQLIAAQLNRAGLIAETSIDVTGVARAGVIKNVFALGLGLADGLNFGYNFKSALTVKILSEYAALLEHFGSDPKLAYSQAGLGDLLTTGWSGKSFNWRTGRDWAHGTKQAKGEGINTLRQLSELMNLQPFPIIHTLETIFLNDGDPLMLNMTISGKAVE